MAERRVSILTDYQDANYAARYRGWVERAKAAEAAQAPGKCGFAEAVGHEAVEWPAEPFDPFFNINDEADLAQAEALLRSR